MCCAYLQKRNYRLGFTNNAKKFFILTDDKITVHPSVEKITCVESLIRLYTTSQISYDDKNYRITFIDSNPNSNKNEVTVQFPDTGLEFGVWRSFILKNVIVDDISLNTNANANTPIPPPPPPPPKKANTSTSSSAIISPIQKNPTTPKINQDYDSYNSFDATTNSTTSVNALDAAKARREARNSESKPPSSSKQFLSKLTSSIPFYPNAKSTPDDSFKSNAYILNSKNDDDVDYNNISNSNNSSSSDINENDNKDESNREIDIDLKEESKASSADGSASTRY